MSKLFLKAFQLFLKVVSKELRFRHTSIALQKATVICLAKSKKKTKEHLGNENSQPELICFANPNYFLQVFTGHSVLIKLCWEKEKGEMELTLQPLRKGREQ